MIYVIFSSHVHGMCVAQTEFVKLLLVLLAGKSVG